MWLRSTLSQRNKTTKLTQLKYGFPRYFLSFKVVSDAMVRFKAIREIQETSSSQNGTFKRQTREIKLFQ